METAATDPRRSRRRKILKMVLAIFLLLTVLRETGIVSLNAYLSKVDVQTNTLSNLKSSSYFAPWDSVRYFETGTDLENSIIRYYYNGEVVHSSGTSEDNLLHVDLNNLSPGLIWTPLVKYSRFSLSTTILVSNSMRVKGSDFIFIFNHHGSMTVTANGTLRVFGISSAYFAKRLILAELIPAIDRRLREELKKAHKEAMTQLKNHNSGQ